MASLVRRNRNPNRKPGRPKRDGSVTVPKTAYFNETEAEAIRKLADALKISESELLHDGALFLAERALIEGVAAVRDAVKPPDGKT